MDKPLNVIGADEIAESPNAWMRRFEEYKGLAEQLEEAKRRVVEIEAQSERRHRLLQISDERVSRLSARVTELEGQLVEANARAESAHNAKRIAEHEELKAASELDEVNAQLAEANQAIADTKRFANMFARDWKAASDKLAEAQVIIDSNRWPDTAAKLLREAEARAESAEKAGAFFKNERDFFEDALRREMESSKTAEMRADAAEKQLGLLLAIPVVAELKQAEARAEAAEAKQREMGEEGRMMTDEIERLSTALEWVLQEIREKIAAERGLKTASIEDYFRIYKRISIGFYDKDVAMLQAALAPTPAEPTPVTPTPAMLDALAATIEHEAKRERGQAWCKECGHVILCLGVDDKLPKHCGHVMTLDSPEERAADAEVDGGED
jgi:chromosome segregation ATPase